jgi:hypothetical protein
VRVGIIDSCRGGGWTQAKGLTAAAAFEVKAPALASEGTALLAASSGLEDAHNEAEALQGSFFTHHLVAVLRGAADQSGDGQVTLSEVFAHADRLTIRDTATHSPQPQHPSFDMRLRGRRDVVLAEVGGRPTTLTVAQKEGPLQLVQLSTGIVLVEATPGEQLLRIALPPGGYLVRRLTPEGVRSLEVQVAAGRSIRVDETSFTLVGEPSLALDSIFRAVPKSPSQARTQGGRQAQAPDDDRECPQGQGKAQLTGGAGGRPQALGDAGPRKASKPACGVKSGVPALRRSPGPRATRGCAPLARRAAPTCSCRTTAWTGRRTGVRPRAAPPQYCFAGRSRPA